MIALLARHVSPRGRTIGLVRDALQQTGPKRASSIVRAILSTTRQQQQQQPRPVNLHRDHRGLDLLQQALCDNEAAQVCELVLQEYPRTQTQFTLGEHLSMVRESTVAILEDLIPSLPFLTLISITPRMGWCWQQNISLRVLRLLKRHPTREIRLQMLPLLPEVLQGLQRLLQGNSVIQKLHLGMVPPGGNPQQSGGSELLDALAVALKANNTLQLIMLSKLELNFPRGNNVDETTDRTDEALLSFLGACPRVLMLSDASFISNSNSSGGGRFASQTGKQSCSSRMQFFKVHQTKLSRNCVESFLDATLNHIPRLVRLELDLHIVPPTASIDAELEQSVNISSHLVALINRGMLQHLVVTGQNFTVDLDTIIREGLTTNRSLQHYNVPSSTDDELSQWSLVELLKISNTTLVHVIDFEQNWTPERHIRCLARDSRNLLWFYTNVNKYSRRGLAQSASEFLAWLDCILAHNFAPAANVPAGSPSTSVVSSREDWQFLFLYELLLHAPGNWTRLLEQFSRPSPVRRRGHRTGSVGHKKVSKG